MATLARFSHEIAPQADSERRRLAAGAQTGRLVRVDNDGRVFVDFDGNPSGPIPAKLAVGDMEIARLINGSAGTEILLVFENNDLAQPVIVGQILDRLPMAGIEIFVRGRRFTVETEDELELRCGEAKVRITRDGKITVLGNDVVSRARRRNRIKGGTVNIN